MEPEYQSNFLLIADHNFLDQIQSRNLIGQKNLKFYAVYPISEPHPKYSRWEYVILQVDLQFEKKSLAS
jgi:hypothetical protein